MRFSEGYRGRTFFSGLVKMPGRLFITPRDSAPCIPRPLSLPEGPASRSATPNASNTTAGLRRRLHGQTHDKRAAHQTRYALDTAATVSSLLQHRDRTKSQKNSSLVPSQAPRLLKTRKNDSLAPSQAPRPRKIPEKQQSRPLSGTETAQNPRKTTVSSLLKHRDRAKPRKKCSLVPSQAPRLLKPRKNHSLVPSKAPRPRKTPEKPQSRPIPSTETAHYGREGGMG